MVFSERVQLEEERAQSTKVLLLSGRQIAFMIYSSRSDYRRFKAELFGLTDLLHVGQKGATALREQDQVHEGETNSHSKLKRMATKHLENKTREKNISGSKRGCETKTLASPPRSRGDPRQGGCNKWLLKDHCSRGETCCFKHDGSEKGYVVEKGLLVLCFAAHLFQEPRRQERVLQERMIRRPRAGIKCACLLQADSSNDQP